MNQSPEVAVIGAGMSGLYLGEQLKQAGYPFRIYEKADAVGGTWRENTYPGLHVDVVTRSYEFPFLRNRTWSRRYAPGTEIRDYLQRVARERELLPSITFGTEIRSARWAEDGRWTLSTADGGEIRADIVVSATGFLHHPTIPKFPGMDSFRGAAFHSARWDHSVPLEGKRIGVIGTGSSGIQIVCELGKRGHDVTHFMRTPQWIQVKENPRIRRYERILLGVPALARYWDWRMRRTKVKTDGSDQWKLVPGAERDEMTRRFLKVLGEEVADPALRAKLTPDYQLGCKRIPKSPDFYRVVQQPNVHPVFGPVSRIEPEGVVDAEGNLHELDVLVYATGFDSHAYMRPMEVEGADGVTVNELWKDGVFSFKGVGLPSMPNFFLLSGPFAPVNSVAIPGSLHDEVGYLLQLFDVIRSTGDAYAPTRAAVDRFIDEVREALPNTTFVACDNWYKDSAGVPILWPWTRDRHGEILRTLDLGDFDRFPVPVVAGERVP